MRAVPAAALAITSLALAACTSSSGSSAAFEGGAAVWSVGPNEAVTPSTKTFTATVSRLGCNGGVTGDVSDPDIQVNEDEVVITFTVTPKQTGDATCPGNNLVLYEVTLPEQLGERALVDGQCFPGR